jgi:hypothetical protein
MGLQGKTNIKAAKNVIVHRLFGAFKDIVAVNMTRPRKTSVSARGVERGSHHVLLFF